MTALRRHAPIFWAVVLLLLAGGPFVQARESLSCGEDHSAEHAVMHASDAVAQSESCPAEEHCCNVCGGSFLLSEAADLPPVLFLSQSYHSLDESYQDGPSFEIDYPPQLS